MIFACNAQSPTDSTQMIRSLLVKKTRKITLNGEEIQGALNIYKLQGEAKGTLLKQFSKQRCHQPQFVHPWAAG